MTTGTAATESVTRSLLTAYLSLHRVLDDSEMETWDRSVELSRASAEIAVAYSGLTGEKIGAALGWDK